MDKAEVALNLVKLYISEARDSNDNKLYTAARDFLLKGFETPEVKISPVCGLDKRIQEKFKDPNKVTTHYSDPSK